MSNWKKYRKAIVALVGAALTGVNILYGTNPYVQAIIGVATALGVYQTPNEV